jgi:hypothetical protein
LARAGDAPRIKLDLTDHERLVLPIDRRNVHHPYSDLPPTGIQVSTYCFEEVFAEKVRALAERLRPRDLYDVVHLYRRKELNPDLPQLMHALREKCAFKKIAVPDFASIQVSPLIAELQVSWAQMLAHQLPELPPFDGFWVELPAVFDWLHSRVEQPVMAALAVGVDTDTNWHIPAMASSWRSLGIGAPMEVIRFSAANRLCVQLEYRKESGERTQPVIEPYSLRRTQDGNYVLHGVEADSGGNRSYRVDRVDGATVTQRSFTARYLVELTETGVQPAPVVVRPATTANREVFRASKPSGLKAKSSMGGGPKYTFRCTACGKTFTRTTYDGALNEHKNKQGYPCFGRFGSLVKTQY